MSMRSDDNAHLELRERVNELAARRELHGVLYHHHPCGDDDSEHQVCATCRETWPCDEAMIDGVIDVARDVLLTYWPNVSTQR